MFSKPEQIETSSLSDLCSKSLPCSLIRYSLHDKTSIVYSIGSCIEVFDTLAALHGVAVLRHLKPVAPSTHVSFFKCLCVLALRKKTVAYPDELGHVITFWGSWCMWAYIKIKGAGILTDTSGVCCPLWIIIILSHYWQVLTYITLNNKRNKFEVLHLQKYPQCNKKSSVHVMYTICLANPQSNAWQCIDKLVMLLYSCQSWCKKCLKSKLINV